MVLRDRFILENELGRGGMGIVYRAIDRRRLEAGARQPYVAIKMLNLSFASHPDALRGTGGGDPAHAGSRRSAHHHVYDFDRDGTHAFIVMELLEGVGLDRLLREEPTFCGSEDAQRVLRDLMEALAFTHSRGAIHADLKPGNLFLCADGRLKVLDFGISAVAGQNALEEAPISGLTPSYACVRAQRGRAALRLGRRLCAGLPRASAADRPPSLRPHERQRGRRPPASRRTSCPCCRPPPAARSMPLCPSTKPSGLPMPAHSLPLHRRTGEPQFLFSFWSARKNG